MLDIITQFGVPEDFLSLHAPLIALLGGCLGIVFAWRRHFRASYFLLTILVLLVSHTYAGYAAELDDQVRYLLAGAFAMAAGSIVSQLVFSSIFRIFEFSFGRRRRR